MAEAEVLDWNGSPLRKVKINTVAFRGWIPDEAMQLKGTLVLIPGRHGDGRGMAEEKQWQDLAKQVGFALIGCQFTNGEPFLYQQDPDGEVAKAIDNAVTALSVRSKHPELEKGPLAFWGTSAGSNVSSRYCTQHPERVAAFGSSKGTFGPGVETSAATREIPMFFALGARDNPEWLEFSQRNIEKGIGQNAPWILAVSDHEGHEVGESLNAIIPFLKAAIEIRLSPSKQQKTSRSLSSKKVSPFTKLQKIDLRESWLGNPDTYAVAPFNEFKDNRAVAIWLCNERVATAWKDYLLSGDKSQ